METYQGMLIGNRDRGSEVGLFTGTTSPSSKGGSVKDSNDGGLGYMRYANGVYLYDFLG